MTESHGIPIFGSVSFGGAEFSGDARFDGAEFTGDARFDGAKFTGHALFGEAEFTGDARFDGAKFTGHALFDGAKFTRDASFEGAEFAGGAAFGRAKFSVGASFEGAEFAGEAWFGWAEFGGGALFSGAQFTTAHTFGPVTCQRTLRLDRATFAQPVTLEIATQALDCTRTSWSSTATLRLRHARVDLTDAVLGAPLAVTAHRTPFTTPLDEELPEGALGNTDAPVRMVSVSGVDATNLVLTDTDLTECVFTGAFHLDHLRLEGRLHFAQPPTGWRWYGLIPTRWSPRRTLAEEHLWRHATHAPGWTTPSAPPPAPSPAAVSRAVPEPDGLAVTYRALRKALEDRGDAPGAADFYYGEMEARRHDPTITRAERGLLRAYWLLSGYGLRASRALASLIVVMTITVALIVLFGLPATTPTPVTTGVPQPSGRIVLHTTTPDAVLPPWSGRVDGQRVGQALPVVLNAVIFRASDNDLTTAGVYLDMAARLLEPSLLALAVLALRGRVKR
ncbi:MAG TPA: pentapeptide repeat-containing protein [Pseudonocardiaceae bacterium]|nr:pentapeptide repeat-containing protein [Pseudonocardiaceae bacterium]